MDRLYPPALLECIQECRPPTPQEIEILAEKIGREAFPRIDSREVATGMAVLALCGERRPEDDFTYML